MIQLIFGLIIGGILTYFFKENINDVIGWVGDFIYNKWMR